VEESKISPNTVRTRCPTLVFRLGDNKQVLVDRSPDCEYKSVEEEIKDIRPFWKASLESRYKQSWLPSDDKPLKDLRGFTRGKKSFSNYVTQDDSPPADLKLYPPPSDGSKYCRKIRIIPTRQQKKVFQQCFGATRFMWNRALNYANEHPEVSKNFYTLAKAVVLTREHLGLPENAHLRWLKDVHYYTRRQIVSQLCSNFEANFTNIDNGLITHFQMRYKTKKNPNQMFFVAPTALKPAKLRLFTKTCKDPFKVLKKKDRLWLKQQKKVQTVIKREKDRYYLCFPADRPPKALITTYKKVALDPGVRTFQTFYSDEGIAGKIGHSVCEHLIVLGEREDQLKSILARRKMTRRTMRNLRRSVPFPAPCG